CPSLSASEGHFLGISQVPFAGAQARTWSYFGAVVTLRFLTTLPSLSVNRAHPDQSIFSLTTLNTNTFIPFCSVTSVVSWYMPSARAWSCLSTCLPLRYTIA